MPAQLGSQTIEDGRQAIMDLGLFKQVSTTVEPIAGKSGAMRLLYTVDEKRFLLVLPKLSRSGDGDLSYGAQLRWDNLFGLNQELRLTFKNKDLKTGDIDHSSVGKLEWKYPRVLGSPYQLFLALGTEDSDLDEERFGIKGNYQRRLDAFEFEIAKWLRRGGPSKGWRYGAGIRYERYDHTYLAGTPDLFFDANILTWVGMLENNEVHDYLYSRQGKRFSYRLEFASSELGSDRSFTRHTIRYRQYKPVTKRPHTNLNWQLRAGIANRSIFGDPSFGLGGSSNLRGHDRDSIEGDGFVLLNVEFLTPFRTHKKSLRGIVFFDVGGAHQSGTDAEITDFKTGVGFGLRWVVRSFVRTVIRADVAQGFNGGETKFYFSTRMTF